MKGNQKNHLMMKRCKKAHPRSEVVVAMVYSQQIREKEDSFPFPAKKGWRKKKEEDVLTVYSPSHRQISKRTEVRRMSLSQAQDRSGGDGAKDIAKER